MLGLNQTDFLSFAVVKEQRPISGRNHVKKRKED